MKIYKSLKSSHKYSKGYVALLAVLIMGAAALTMSLAILSLGTDSQRSALTQQQAVQARSLAITCGEEALQYLHDNPSAGTSGNIIAGNTTIGGSTDTGNVNTVLASKVTSTVAGTVSSVSIYIDSVTSGDQAKFAIYSHSSGTNLPNTTIATSNVVTLTTGWNTIPISATVTTATDYWIAAFFQNASTVQRRSVAGGRTVFRKPIAWGSAFPSPFGTVDAGPTADYYSFYMTVNGGSSLTLAGSMALGQGTCSYVLTGSSTRTVDVTATVGNIVRKVRVKAAVTTLVSPTGWQEYADVPTFTPPTGSLTPSTITHVQSVGGKNDVGGATLLQAYSSNVVSGNLLVTAVSWDTFGNRFTFSCTDTRGNTYSNIGTVWEDTTTDQAIGICYTISGSSGANTVTVTFGGDSPNILRMIVSEYSGVASVSPMDAYKGIAGATATAGATDAVTSGSVTTSNPGDLIYGVVIDTDLTTTIAAGTGFTQRASVNAKEMSVQDKIQATAGSVASTQTFGAAHRYDAAVVAFKAVLQ